MHDGHGSSGGEDLIEVSIMDDGSVKVETFGEISEINHMAADKIVRFLADHFEGTPVKIRKSKAHVHARERVRR